MSTVSGDVIVKTEEDHDALPVFDFEPKIPEPAAMARPMCGRFGGPLVFFGPSKLIQAQVATWVLLLFPQFLYFAGISVGFDVLLVDATKATALRVCSTILLFAAVTFVALCSFTEPGSIPRKTHHDGEQNAIATAFQRICKQARKQNETALAKIKEAEAEAKEEEGFGRKEDSRELVEGKRVSIQHEKEEDCAIEQKSKGNAQRKGTRAVHELVASTNEERASKQDEITQGRLAKDEVRGFPFHPIASNRFEPSLASVSPQQFSPSSTSRLSDITVQVDDIGRSASVKSVAELGGGERGVGPRTPPQLIHIERGGKRVLYRFCDRCAIYRPPRALHCPWCNHCCEELDHHCPWLNNCIAKNNM